MTGRANSPAYIDDPGILAAYPTLRAAARIIGVEPSTLSRRRDLPTQPRADERRFPPALVLSLARHYRRRSLEFVASELLDYAYEHAESYAASVDQEIEAAMGPSPATSVDGQAFLAEAQRALPRDLFEAVVAAYGDAGGIEPVKTGVGRRARSSAAHRG